MCSVRTTPSRSRGRSCRRERCGIAKGGLDARRRTHPPSFVLLAPGNARRTDARDPGARRTHGSVDDSALHGPESSGARQPFGCWISRFQYRVWTFWRPGGSPKEYDPSGPPTRCALRRTTFAESMSSLACQPELAHLGRRAKVGGEAGIRTLGTGLSPYNGLANRRLQPLGHLTALRKYM